MLHIDHLLIGSIAPLGPRRTASGIDKGAISGRLWLDKDGFTGDAQGDRKHHGGVEKAVHHYAFDHYEAWRSAIGAIPILRRPGAFGENISTTGLAEAMVAVGDVYRVGEALIEVSQGRQPCWRLNARFGLSDMALRVQESGRIGWYYRVLEPGFVAAGDSMDLIDRCTPDWTIERLWYVFYVDPLNFDELAAMSVLPSLPEDWRRYAQRRLATRVVEDWAQRLKGD